MPYVTCVWRRCEAFGQVCRLRESMSMMPWLTKRCEKACKIPSELFGMISWWLACWPLAMIGKRGRLLLLYDFENTGARRR